jgi:hypothetical protein
MKDIIHLIYTPFTGLGLHNGFRGDDWYKYRIEHWKNYTLRSLKNQTNKNFIYWISFRPEERENPLTQEIVRELEKCEFKSVLTFEGLCFYDDKFDDKQPLLNRLRRTLPELKELIGNNKYVYMTILASDDMYHKDAVADIQKEEFRYQGSLNHAVGYVYSTKTKKLAVWQPPFPEKNPPFDTLMFPTEIFLDSIKHLNYSGPYKDHWQVTKIFNWKRMKDFHYCVLVHEQNISTHWRVIEMRNWKAMARMLLTPYNWIRLFQRIVGKVKWKNMVKKHEYIGEEITQNKEIILKQFGI